MDSRSRIGDALSRSTRSPAIMVYTVYTMDCAPEATVLSRVFRSGNSQAVRIPKDLAFDPAVQEVEIERHGDGLLIRPARRESFDGLVRVLTAFPQEFMAAGRAPQDQSERDWQAADRKKR